jgi:hypothetical protein
MIGITLQSSLVLLSHVKISDSNKNVFADVLDVLHRFIGRYPVYVSVVIVYVVYVVVADDDDDDYDDDDGNDYDDDDVVVVVDDDDDDDHDE